MKLRPLSIASVSVVLFALTAAMTSGAPAALKSSTISPILKSAASSKTLANPGLILVDPARVREETGMVGHHGGVTDIEVNIPLLTAN